MRRRARPAHVLEAGLLAVAAASLLMTLPLTSFRPLDPGSKYGVLFAALTPIGTVTALLAVVTALPLMFLATSRLRRGGVALVVISALLLSVHLWWLAPLYLGASHHAAGPSRVVVMSQNFEYGSAEDLRRTVRARGVDVLVVCDTGSAQRAAAIKAARDAGLQHGALDGGTLVFSRFTVRPLSRISDGGDSVAVRVDVPGMGPLTIYALHPTPVYQGASWRSDYRRIQQYIAGGARHRAVMAGDLNATLDNRPLRDVQALGFEDAAVSTNHGWAPTWPSGGGRRIWGVPVPPVLALDHVLTSEDLVVTRMSTVALRGADHFGVVADIGLTR